MGDGAQRLVLLVPVAVPSVVHPFGQTVGLVDDGEHPAFGPDRSDRRVPGHLHLAGQVVHPELGLEFPPPLPDDLVGHDDERGPRRIQQQLPQHHPCFDGLAQAHLVGQQVAGDGIGQNPPGRTDLMIMDLYRCRQDPAESEGCAALPQDIAQERGPALDW